MFEARTDLLEGWASSDAPLSGGAGKEDHADAGAGCARPGQLLRQTAERSELRSTGHAWCISGTRGCHGQGLTDDVQGLLADHHRQIGRRPGR